MFLSRDKFLCVRIEGGGGEVLMTVRIEGGGGEVLRTVRIERGGGEVLRTVYACSTMWTSQVRKINIELFLQKKVTRTHFS